MVPQKEFSIGTPSDEQFKEHAKQVMVMLQNYKRLYEREPHTAAQSLQKLLLALLPKKTKSAEKVQLRVAVRNSLGDEETLAVLVDECLKIFEEIIKVHLQPGISSDRRYVSSKQVPVTLSVVEEAILQLVKGDPQPWQKDKRTRILSLLHPVIRQFQIY